MIIGESRIIEELEELLVEQHIRQKLVSGCGLALRCWSVKSSSGEIDFLVQRQNSSFVIEAKAKEPPCFNRLFISCSSKYLNCGGLQ